MVVPITENDIEKEGLPLVEKLIDISSNPVVNVLGLLLGL